MLCWRENACRFCAEDGLGVVVGDEDGALGLVAGCVCHASSESRGHRKWERVF